MTEEGKMKWAYITAVCHSLVAQCHYERVTLGQKVEHTIKKITLMPKTA